MNRILTEIEESIRIAFEQIWVHKMRSLLTALGVIIGTFRDHYDGNVDEGSR